jgi:hypothetical protein
MSSDSYIVLAVLSVLVVVVSLWILFRAHPRVPH